MVNLVLIFYIEIDFRWMEFVSQTQLCMYVKSVMINKSNAAWEKQNIEYFV